jgi:hypothetical protein
VSVAVSLAVCSNLACRVAETGKCVEGLALERCAHYGRPPVPKADGETKRVEGIALSPGERLALEEAPEILRARETRVVAVIGPRDSGKTSLTAGLYALFLDGPVGGWAFAGGTTLRAFEIACHDARAVSARQAPHFERTPRGPAGLYQLTLSPRPGAPLVDLLIADRAGEEYLEVTDDASASQELPELPRADVITLLVDGKRLLDVRERHNLQADLALILQAMHDGDALREGQRLAIALTKHDAFDGSPQRERAERDFDQFVARTRNQFSGSFSMIESFRLAASPDTDAARRGTGLAELLGSWMRPLTPAAVAMPPPLAPVRAFGRLLPSVG